MSTPEPQAPQAPEPQAPEGSDEAVAQGWFDEWSARVDQDIDHLKASIAQLAQVKGTSNAGPTTSEPSGQAGQGATPQSNNPPATSGSGVQGGSAPAGQPGSVEQPPKSGHWYFKRVFG